MCNDTCLALDSFVVGLLAGSVLDKSLALRKGQESETKEDRRDSDSAFSDAR